MDMMPRTTIYKMNLVRPIIYAICSQKLGGGYNDEPSIFDRITQDDLIMAFFPCVRFENQVMLWFRGQSNTQKDWDYETKMLYDMKLLKELHANYDLVNQLFLICMRRGFKLIFENPFSEEHFLRRYWCISPSIIDRDRTERGDYFTKPTQYWFINCEPKNNMIFEPTNNNFVGCKDAIRNATRKTTGIDASQKTIRSMIHPDYANRFIREFIL